MRRKPCRPKWTGCMACSCRRSQSTETSQRKTFKTPKPGCISHKTRLMPVADQAFSTLLDDLAERGLLDDTLVIWTGEFGRTPRIGQRNSAAGAGADGRDHWPNCFTTVLAGGGIRGGQTYGSSDRLGEYPKDNPITPADVAHTVYHAMGLPDLQAIDEQGRPFSLLDAGQPLYSLF